MPAAPSRPTLRAATAALLLVLAGASAAESGSGASYAIGAPAGAREGWSLSVTGAWATQCPPTLENVALDGADLRIDARSVLGLCTRQATPFSVEVNPAAALNQADLAPGVYHVSFFAADGAQAQQKLRAFSLIDHSAPDAPRVLPETGFWWSAENGADRTLFSVELQNDQLSVALMSYDRFGQPQWQFGAAPYNGRVAHVPLLRLQGGGDLFMPAGSARPNGEATLALDLEFHTGAHASAWLSRVEGSGDDPVLRLRPFDVVRLPLAATVDGGALQGDWVLVDDSGAQRLHFDEFRAVDAEHFELGDSTNAATLACTRDPAQPDLPPSSCTLHAVNRAAAAQFDSVAITRMDGAAVHLLRVSN
jgi:hypothetical protein